MSIIKTLLRGLAVGNYWVSRTARDVAGGLLVLMLVFILAQVVFRLLDNSLGWTEELSKYAMVWVACLVAPWAYRENLNVSIGMFADALPKRLRAFTELIITGLVAMISVIFLIQSLSFWAGGLTIEASSVPIKLSYFYSCTPFLFAMLISVSIERFINQLFELLTGKPVLEHQGGS